MPGEPSPPTLRPATRESVARLAGVAPTTVSLVLNGRGDQVKLSRQTQQRVLDAARQLHYVPNAAARALAGRRTRTIGLVLPGPADPLDPPPVFAQTVVSAMGMARMRGYFILMVECGPDDSPSQLLSRMRDASIDGLVCESRGRAMPLGLEMERSGFPVVWIRRNNEAGLPVDGPVISIDQSTGVAELADLLIATRRDSIAIIVPELTRGDVDRPRYRPLMERFGMRARFVAADEWSSDGGRRAMRQILDSDERPDAVFAGNDIVAAGALHMCREAGLSVPGDIAIAGFGGFELSRHLDPSLTTVAWPLTELGQRAVSRLADLLEGGAQESTVEVLPTTLVVRSSTG